MKFLGLYEGESVASARLVAVCSEPKIVRQFLHDLARESEEPNTDANTRTSGSFD